jgi:peptidoglycan/LPS O-acetylase OafA/YrhL
MTRLYPTYWTSLTLMVVAEMTIFHGRMSPSSGIDIWPAGYVANMTMLQEFFGFTNFDNVFWSLTVELAFYILMAVLFSLRWLRRIEVVAICLLGLACLWPAPGDEPGFGITSIVTRFLILPYLPFFMGGIMFYRLASGGFSKLRVAVLIAALGVEWWLHGPLNLCVAAAIFVIFGLAVGGYLRGLVTPPTLWLGGISYPLYLSHRNLGYSTMLKLHEAGIPTLLILLMTIAGALTLAAALSYLVERPALRALRQWYRERLAAVA